MRGVEDVEELQRELDSLFTGASNNNMAFNAKKYQVRGLIQKKKTGFFLTLSEKGGVNPCQKTFVKNPKLFFVCQIHPKMLKHVLQRWGSDTYLINLNTFSSFKGDTHYRHDPMSK